MIKGKIVHRSDSVEIGPLVFVLYGAPGVYKTSMAFTSNKPFLIDFDGGSQRSEFRQTALEIDKWEDVKDIEVSDLEGYDTLVIDTVGSMLDYLTVYILKTFPRFGSNGTLNQAGWGKLKQFFSLWVKQIKSFKKDLIFVAHAKEEKKVDDIVVRVDVPGGSKEILAQQADCIGYLYAQAKDIIIDFSPTDAFVGKNPGRLQPIKIPDFDNDKSFFARLINNVRETMSSATEEQIKMADKLEELGKKAEEAARGGLESLKEWHTANKSQFPGAWWIGVSEGLKEIAQGAEDEAEA